MAGPPTDLSPDRLAERAAQRGREVRSIIARLDGELGESTARLEVVANEYERARIETEIGQLTEALSRLRRGHYADRSSG